MTSRFKPQSRRAVLGLLASGAAVLAAAPRALADPAMTVFYDPSCGCCSLWIAHVRDNGFAVTVKETKALQAIKAQLGVPAELASCHTGEIAGYVIEGHVPAAAIRRLLSEKPDARGLAVPGMPIGSPGMEGGSPEIYEVILFGDGGQRSYGRFREDKAV